MSFTLESMKKSSEVCFLLVFVGGANKHQIFPEILYEGHSGGIVVVIRYHDNGGVSHVCRFTDGSLVIYEDH